MTGSPFLAQTGECSSPTVVGFCVIHSLVRVEEESQQEQDNETIFESALKRITSK
jgi:hypothetical protein